MPFDAVPSDSLDKYVFVFSDCVPVKGAVASAIYDLTRGTITTFPSEYHPLFESFRTQRLRQILDGFSEEDQANVRDFLEFLSSNEYMTLVDDLAPFPEIPSSFDAAGSIDNAIVDVRSHHHDYRKIVAGLDALGCRHLQVRSYSTLFGLAHLEELAGLCRGTSIQSLEAVLHHEPALSDDDYVRTVSANRIVAGLIVHSADRDRRIRVDYGTSGTSAALVAVEIAMTRRKMESGADCGAISRRELLVPSTRTVNELRLFNGCLNRKLSIDEGGHVRNCPAMERAFGHHQAVALAEVATSSAFQRAWKLRKDEIQVCRDCAYRYACTDCRAFLEHPEAEDSKPLKCGYDPYTDSWADWTARPHAVDTLEEYRRRVRLPVLRP
jgi:SPASM domain peptide maturase of grasp-with-spasm system